MNRVLVILSVFALIITISYIGTTYGLFETNATSSNNLSISRWDIEVNNIDITLTNQISLSNFTYSASNTVADGYFAPGRSGEYDIYIDATNTDVSFEYTFTADLTELEDHPNIVLTVTDVDTNTVWTTDTFSSQVLLSDPNKIKHLKLTPKT